MHNFGKPSIGLIVFQMIPFHPFPPIWTPFLLGPNWKDPILGQGFGFDWGYLIGKHKCGNIIIYSLLSNVELLVLIIVSHQILQMSILWKPWLGKPKSCHLHQDIGVSSTGLTQSGHQMLGKILGLKPWDFEGFSTDPLDRSNHWSPPTVWTCLDISHIFGEININSSNRFSWK